MNEEKSIGFWDRTLANLKSAWGKIGSSGDEFSETSVSPSLDEDAQARLVDQMQACLEARGGEVSARIRAAQLGRIYITLDELGRKRFLNILATEFDVDHEAVADKAGAVGKATQDAARLRAETELRAALAAPRLKLLTQFNGLPEGVKFLVDMRAELLALKKAEPALAGLEGDLKGLLTSWFDVGFLELRQIDWRAPAALLEKLFAYEAVHEIQGWDDLKNRLASDRRCFAFFHPRMPDEPLIFVWVALVKGMAVNVQELLDQSAPVFDADAADTAIFYSISNAQDGLSGINFGNFLIKRVLDSLSVELKGLKQFATLSPIPGFMRWLMAALENPDYTLLKDGEAEALTSLAGKLDAGAAIKALLTLKDWHQHGDVTTALEAPLLRAAAYFLMRVKRSSGTAQDSVAHFHLNNGAHIGQLNWGADLSERGLAQSAGIMLNYVYEPDQIESNHESYRSGLEVIASGPIQAVIKDY